MRLFAVATLSFVMGQTFARADASEVSEPSNFPPPPRSCSPWIRPPRSGAPLPHSRVPVRSLQDSSTTRAGDGQRSDEGAGGRGIDTTGGI